MATPPEYNSWEEILSEFLHKTLHAILAARVPYFLSATAAPCHSSHSPRTDRWFHIALGDLADSIELPGGGTDPLVVDIFLTHRSGDADSWDSDLEAVAERWIANFVPASLSSAASLRPQVGTFHRQTYKKFMILLRSIYALLRLLPAYRFFRRLCSSSQLYNYDLCYRTSSFVAPFSRAKEAELKLYRFTPVETQFGRFVATVQYLPNLSNFHIEEATPMPPIIIPDYVGSPAADPMRYFPASLRNRESRSISFMQPPRGAQTSAAPSFGRRRSWSNAVMMHRHFRFVSPVSQSESLLSERSANPVPNQQPVGKSKGIKDNQDDSTRAFSSGVPPRHAVSRNLTRLSTHKSDDENFPFAVDNVKTADSDTRFIDDKEAPDFARKSERASYKSREAAVGVLVHMLRTAAPLQQCQSRSLQSSELNEEVSMSSSATPRKIRDALEELQTYKEMNILLSKRETR